LYISIKPKSYCNGTTTTYWYIFSATPVIEKEERNSSSSSSSYHFLFGIVQLSLFSFVITSLLWISSFKLLPVELVAVVVVEVFALHLLYQPIYASIAINLQ
jgi:hypothetical protein